MTKVPEPPKPLFELRQLIYDTKYRSLTVQAIAMCLLVLFFSWLINNTIQNLTALGKDFDFGFLPTSQAMISISASLSILLLLPR